MGGIIALLLLSLSARSIDGLQRQRSPCGLQIASMNFMPGVQMQGSISCLQFHSYFCALHSAPREGTVEQLTAENHVACALCAFYSSPLRGLIWALNVLIIITLTMVFHFRDLDFGFTLRSLEEFTKEQKEWIVLVYGEQCRKVMKLLWIRSKEGIKIGRTLYICLLEWPYV